MGEILEKPQFSRKEKNWHNHRAVDEECRIKTKEPVQPSKKRGISSSDEILTVTKLKQLRQGPTGSEV